MRMAEVHELVDTVAELDPACRERGALSAAVAASARLRAWLDGRDVALAAQVEQVASYPEKVLADASRTSLRDAERTVQRAVTSRVLPQLGEALSDGAVSGAHVDVAGRALGQLEPRQRDGLIERADWLTRWRNDARLTSSGGGWRPRYVASRPTTAWPAWSVNVGR